ncbi:MAG: hypothetical protein K8S98_15520 [Planctomycetes bacterium]|nr:hypothetical protein [Planctomycetota bacterium]
MTSLRNVKVLVAGSLAAVVLGVAAVAGGTTGLHPLVGPVPLNAALCNKGYQKKYECNGALGVCVAALPTDKCAQICLDANAMPTAVLAKIKWIQCIDAN